MRELPREIEDLLYDPQTSGGLLISLAEADAARLEQALEGAYRIGRRAGSRRKGDSTDMNYNPIIIALDVETAADARALVKRIGGRVSFYKVGLELYTARRPGDRARADRPG